MAKYVEVNDEGAALSAAGQLSELGGRLDDKSLPEQVVWGDDKYGRAMLERYHDGNVPVLAMEEKPKLGHRLTEIGDATTRAVTDDTTQELLNQANLNGVPAPQA